MVKVFEATITSVVSGSRPRVVSYASVGSMLDRKRASRPSWARGFSASYTMTGPRSLPPMPMFTTVSMRLPVTPVHSPERTFSANS